MKKIIGVLIILVVLFVGFYFSTKRSVQPLPVHPSITPTRTTIVSSYCLPAELQKTVTLDPGAGNINGTFEIKNISDRKCQIIGDNEVSANYNKQIIKNIVVKQNDQPAAKLLQLAPHQSLYAKVHYPNGPQCQGPTVLQNITFSYQTSPTDSITFTDQRGATLQAIQVCPTLSQVTTVDLWHFSPQPVN